MLELLISLLAVCLFLYVAWWGLSRMALPEPARTIVVVVFAIICLVVLANYLPLGGLPRGRWG